MIGSHRTSLQEKKVFEGAQTSARIRLVLIVINVYQDLIADIDYRERKRPLASRSGACSEEAQDRRDKDVRSTYSCSFHACP